MYAWIDIENEITQFNSVQLSSAVLHIYTMRLTARLTLSTGTVWHRLGHWDVRIRRIQNSSENSRRIPLPPPTASIRGRGTSKAGGVTKARSATEGVRIAAPIPSGGVPVVMFPVLKFCWEVQEGGLEKERGGV